jgi:hypothetical protein
VNPVLNMLNPHNEDDPNKTYISKRKKTINKLYIDSSITLYNPLTNRIEDDFKISRRPGGGNTSSQSFHGSQATSNSNYANSQGFSSKRKGKAAPINEVKKKRKIKQEEEEPIEILIPDDKGELIQSKQKKRKISRFDDKRHGGNGGLKGSKLKGGNKGNSKGSAATSGRNNNGSSGKRPNGKSAGNLLNNYEAPVVLDITSKKRKLNQNTIKEALKGLFVEEKPDEKFCICRRGYDEIVPMVECDCCKEWFHYECLSLKKNQVNTSEAYICMGCCQRKGTPYKFEYK